MCAYSIEVTCTNVSQSVFSMNGMFNWRPGPDQNIASPYLYVFFVVTVPLTAVLYIAWFVWFRYSQKHHTRRHDEGQQDIDEKLRLAVRSATGTW